MMSALEDGDSFDTAEEEDFGVRFDPDFDTRHLPLTINTDYLPAHQAEHKPLLQDDDGSDVETGDVTFLRDLRHDVSDARRDVSDARRDVSDLSEDASFTVEDAVEYLGFGWFQVKIICICGLFSATDSLEMLLLAVLAPILRCEWMLPHGQVAFLTTAVFIGMFVGSGTWGKWADQYGRKPILMIAAVWICYMGILTSFSPNYYWILILRGLVGSGFGGAVQSFTLMSEYLPSKSRAKILIIYNVMWALGSCFEMWLAYIVIPTLGWRWLVAFSALPTLVSILCLWSMPESARYLVAAGQKDKALAVLQQAAKQNGKKLLTGEIIESKQAERGQIKDMLCSKFTRTTLQVWFMWFGTAFSYYGIVLLSSEPRLLNYPKTCGQDKVLEVVEARETCHCELLTKADYETMIIATFGEFCAIPLNLATIDSLGRRLTLLINFLCSALFFFLIQLCTTMTWMTVFMFGVRAFAAAIFNTTYIYTSEAYPTTLRSLAIGSSSAMARVGAMITPFIAQVLVKTSLPLAVSVYGVVNILCAICAGLLPIETKGREMSQTQR